MLISPIVLVRLLTVEEFGRYREFLLYVTVLSSFASLGFNNSLLYFVAATPDNTRQLLKQTALLTFVSSFASAMFLVIGNAALGGTLTGAYTWAVAIYVLLYVNLDFWEFFWLARNQPLRVFLYATGRLAARMAVVVTAAAVAGDVWTVIWSVVAFEALRLTGSAFLWIRTLREEPHGESRSSWREQLRYCLPVSGASVLVMLNKQLGNLAVAKMMGAASLAYYSIGTQIQPVVTVLRNSLSDVLLPEMASRRRAGVEPLELWRRTTVVSMILLLAAGILLIEFAHPLVTTLFSEQYAPAVAVFQLYALVLVREVLDFGVPLRAINRTTPIVQSNLLAFAVNVVLLFTLMPAYGLLGAVAAFLIARFVDGAYLAFQVMKLYEIPLSRLASWGDLAKVALANAIASVVLVGSMWTDHFGFAGIVIGSAVYLSLLVVALAVLRVPEITRLMRGLRQMPLSAP